MEPGTEQMVRAGHWGAGNSSLQGKMGFKEFCPNECYRAVSGSHYG